jgi:protein-S-isoprenylcysteine O-methyltransferase Ste14
MLNTLLAYILLAAFYGLEGFLRKGQGAKSLSRGSYDRGSTTLIGVSFGLATILAPLLNYFSIGRFPAAKRVGRLGIVAMLSGLVLRFWSMRVLGEYYTRTLQVTGQQAVVDQGPYRVIRHPGYLGTLLVWIGAGIAMANWLATALIPLLMGTAYAYRIRSEEAMLLDTLGKSYQGYRERTWRLIPYIY